MSPHSSSSFPEVEDILSEIFRRLPMKSVGRCRCVKKSWYYFTKTSDFINFHLNDRKQFPKNKYNLISNGRTSKYTLCSNDNLIQISYERPPFSHKYHTSYGTSNGIICLSSRMSKLSLFTPIYFWNPAIKKFKTIPDSQLYPRSFYKVSLGFGYLPKINDYKVIRIMIYHRIDYRSWRTTAEVYSLSTNSWKKVCENSNVGVFSWCDLSVPTFVSGVSYWIGTKENHEKVIVCFDMENEIFREILLPRLDSNKYQRYLLYAFDELLHLIIYDRRPFSSQMCVMEGGIWKKKIFSGKSEEKRGYPLGFWNTGQLITLSPCQKIMMCLENGYETVEVLPDEISFSDSMDQSIFVNPFVESLILLGNDDN